MDYPFSTWTGYFGALTESLSTEYYGETYPQYEKQMNRGNTDANIIQRLLKLGLDPQEGFDGFLQALLDGHRYASDMPDIATILAMFIEKGAKPNIDCLFEINCTSFEDEVQSYEVRGSLIDDLSQFDIDVSKIYDWSSIEAVHHEELTDDEIEEDYEKACRMVLKSKSQYLREQ
jgi:hypothetical protein